MPPSSPPSPRVHLADPVEASDAARSLRDAVVGTLVERPERAATFERLRGRVAVHLDERGGAEQLVGLVFDRGTLTIWDGAPPGGTDVRLDLHRPLTRGRHTPVETVATPARRGVRVRSGRRHVALTTGTLRLLGVL